MFAVGYSILKLLGRDSDAPRWLAALAALVAILLACGAIYATWQAFDWFNDRAAVKEAANKANAAFAEDKDKASGEADVASAQRRAAHQAQVKQTEELVDEALDKGCVVSDYLASGGADCVRPPAGVSRPAPE